MGRFMFRVGLCLLVLAATRMASAVIGGGDDPPNLDVDIACCVPEVELPPSTCVNDVPFTTEDGYCAEGRRADGSCFCHTTGTCTCAALQLQGVWESADCVSALLGEEESPKCCRVFKELECAVWDGDCEMDASRPLGDVCTGCSTALAEPQPLVLPTQKDVIVCDVGRGGSCKVCGAQ